MTDREKTVEDVFETYLEIKMDLLSDLSDVFLRPYYWSKKYRGNINTDINVHVAENDYKEHYVYIFVRHGGVWIRDKMIYNRKGLKDSLIKTNMYVEE